MDFMLALSFFCLFSGYFEHRAASSTKLRMFYMKGTFAYLILLFVFSNFLLLCTLLLLLLCHVCCSYSWLSFGPWLSFGSCLLLLKLLWLSLVVVLNPSVAVMYHLCFLVLKNQISLWKVLFSIDGSVLVCLCLISIIRLLGCSWPSSSCQTFYFDLFSSYICQMA